MFVTILVHYRFSHFSSLILTVLFYSSTNRGWGLHKDRKMGKWNAGIALNEIRFNSL
jgi:hypothetical protein